MINSRVLLSPLTLAALGGAGIVGAGVAIAARALGAGPIAVLYVLALTLATLAAVSSTCTT